MESIDDLFSLFKKYIKKNGLQTNFGGKLINISGVHTTRCFDLFLKKYLKEFKTNKIIISIGDSENDVEMLNYADYSGIVIREDNRKISLIKNQLLLVVFRPEGWVEVLKKITKEMGNKISDFYQNGIVSAT